jgi:hypothetical protein
VAAGLNQSQVANLDRWGYPYLFADFRFHMTLTGKVGWIGAMTCWTHCSARSAAHARITLSQSSVSH